MGPKGNQGEAMSFMQNTYWVRMPTALAGDRLECKLS